MANATTQAANKARQQAYKKKIELAAKCYDITTLAVKRIRGVGPSVLNVEARREWDGKDPNCPDAKAPYHNYYPADLSDIESARVILQELLCFIYVPHIVERILNLAEYWVLESRICNLTHLNPYWFDQRKMTVGPFFGRSSITEETLVEGSDGRSLVPQRRLPLEKPFALHLGQEARRLQQALTHTLPRARGGREVPGLAIKRIRVRVDRPDFTSGPYVSVSYSIMPGNLTLICLSEDESYQSDECISQISIGGDEFCGGAQTYHELDIYMEDFRGKFSGFSSSSVGVDEVGSLRDAVHRNVACWLQERFSADSVFAIGCPQASGAFGRTAIEIFYARAGL